MFDLSQKLNELSRQGLRRSRRIVESPQGINLICDGKPVINFCSNDYLGLANHSDVINTFKSAADKYGVGSGSAHLICGHSSAHHALEQELADFTGRDRALLFSTGYMANMGTIAALVGRGDAVLEDRLNHASLLDGGLFSGAKFKRYAHADVDHLQKLLGNSKAIMNSFDTPHSSPLHQGEGIFRRLIVTDGVFSMDGDVAPVQALSAVAKRHGVWLMVDDAHGLGVFGAHGGGVTEELALSQDDVQVLVGTLGKAFGTFGAFVAGSEELIETLINSARTYIYTTALPPAVAEATRASLKILQTETWRREKLLSLVERFRTGAAQLGLPMLPSSSPIQPVLVGESETASKASQFLCDNGFLVSAIRPPTVPANSARLRVTFSALHEEHHIDHLLAALADSLK